jgi:hypothetical protein
LSWSTGPGSGRQSGSSGLFSSRQEGPKNGREATDIDRRQAMTVKDRGVAIARAKKALAHLEKHPGTTRKQLGDARDLVNRVHNWNDEAAVGDAIYGLECIVLNVYGGIPEEDRQN